ncbi:LPXTG cell wall anchor domain-containing protein [Mogibacterium sp.]|uniref:LPXTG cell wall anchor domain-containing protein n=1 Tax=Mogibacterium sp. TaxID=2049035 RepID=UPI00257F41C9|nr:LPXTG cell wall anchor domain-containing protein [Mogibacterium sp.]
MSKITFTLKYNKPNTPVNPTNPTNPTTPGKTTKVVKTVKTGDTTNLLFYLLMAGGSIAGIAGAASYRRRESR